MEDLKMDKETKLMILEQYGEEAFRGVPDRSALKGKEFCGYLYSPYFFRRYIGHQFERLVSLWGATDRKMSPIDFIAHGVKVGEVACVQNAATVEEATAEIVNSICEGSDYLWRAVLGPRCKNPIIKRYVIQKICNHKGLEIEKVEKASEEYLAEWLDLDDFLQQIRWNDAVQKSVVTKVAKAIQHSAEYINGQNVLWGNTILFVEPDNITGLAHKMVKEVTTLAVLEQHGDEIFEERKQFLPLDLVNRVFFKNWESYKEAAKKIPKIDYMTRKLLNVEALEGYKFKYALAGYFYWRRNKIAFGNGTTEEFEKAKAEIPAWSEEKLMDEIGKLADELVGQKKKEISLKAMNVF